MLLGVIMILSILPLVGLATGSVDPIVGARSLAISPNGEQLAFSYRGDLWVAPSNGGHAVPISTNVELEDFPVWSRDGKQIAFASNRNGGIDIFVVGVSGGTPKRLTFHSGSDIPSDWSIDNRKILFRATRDRAENGIFELDVETGKFKAVFYDQMSIGNPKYSPDGTKIVYTRYGFPWFRPRYNGSAASQLWVYDVPTGKRTKLRDNQLQHLWPNWTKEGITAITVTEKTPNSSPLGKPIPLVNFTTGRTPNVYSFDMGGKAKALTTFANDGTRFLTAAQSKNAYAFERDGDVYVSQGGAPAKIEMIANTDEKFGTEERLVLTTGVESADLSLDGENMVFAVRSEIWTVPIKRGKGPNKDDATQRTTWEGVDGQPLWSPDGKSVFFVSDRDGAERLFSLNVADNSVKPITTANADIENIMFTPDKTRISYWMAGKEGGLYTVPIGGGTPTRVIEKPSASSFNYSWSPDGKWVAYSEALINSGYYYWEVGQNIFVAEVATGKKHNVTQLNAIHDWPRWSPDGKYLLFTSNRSGGGLFLLPLMPEDKDAPEVIMEYKKPTESVKVEIDFDNIETRARRLIGAQVTMFEFDPENGNIIFGAEGDLWRAAYNGEGVSRLTAGGGVSSFKLTTDQKNMLFLRGGTMNLLELRKPNSPQTNVSFRADWTRDVLKERNAAWKQMYRIYNRTFYDPGFHGRDWAAIMAKYQKYIPSVGHRNEMATILNMAVGELEASHAEVGAAPGGPSAQSSAHLGFTFDYSYTGKGIRVGEVPAQTPGSYRGTKINAGDIITKINGTEVSTDETLYREVLNEQSGRELKLTVQSAGGATREVVYRAMSQGGFNNTVFQNLLEARRKYVESKSGGKLTYAHIAGMSGGELDRFNQRVWQSTQGKKGLIIDVRNNGGGNTSDRIIDVLERKLNAYYVPRDEPTIGGPGQVLDFPMVVMCNQTSFSNAEMFPNSMRTRGLAKLVGMPTPGYVIYTYGGRLVDGTSIRLPSTGVYRLDGSNMENDGVVPDFALEVSPEDFFAGRDPQLDKSIEVLLSQIK